MIPFEPWHLESMLLQPAQAYLRPLIEGHDLAALGRAGPAFTALALHRDLFGAALPAGDPVGGPPGQGWGWARPDVREGERAIGCAGIVTLWAGRAAAWCFLSPDAGRHLVAIHRAVRRFLDGCAIRRVETSVDHGFAAGHRWAALLGFRLEGHMRAYTPDGRDCDLYARVVETADARK